MVKAYLNGEGSCESLGRQYGIGYSTLRRWVSAFRAHGEAGLRKKHETYSADFKMSVLQHMWRHELSYQRTCAVFDLREANCVSRWERQYHEGGFEALMPRRKGHLVCPVGVIEDIHAHDEDPGAFREAAFHNRHHAVESPRRPEGVRDVQLVEPARFGLGPHHLDQLVVRLP
ncbi:helix-turn-helix domain-containing protein [Burkholderia sp. AU30198]|uniref:helix-turn-helix domain-containing protein n=1 Tax=Burkholderia sp. AU30198 TaxID=2879627 RepID=UPI0039A45495